MLWNDNNHNTRQAQKLQEARKAWEESERVLKILRTQTATRIRQATDQEVLEWYTNLNRKR